MEQEPGSNKAGLWTICFSASDWTAPTAPVSVPFKPAVGPRVDHERVCGWITASTENTIQRTGSIDRRTIGPFLISKHILYPLKIKITA